MRKMFRIVPVLLITGLCFSEHSALAPRISKQEAVRPQKPLHHEVSVTLKLIHVYVSDKNGNPARGLTKDDFVVYDNGRAMTITDFERYTLEAPAGKPEPRAKETIIPTPLPSAARVAAVTRRFFLFFDFAYNHPKGIEKAKEAALHFIDAELIPGDEVGVLSYSTLNGLSIDEYLTTNHRKVRAAVKTVSAKSFAGKAEDTEEEYWRTAGQGGGSIYAKSHSQLEAERSEAKIQAQNFILKMTALAKALRYVPGQKHFILFSTGIPSSLFDGNRMTMQTWSNRGSSSTQFKIDAGDKALLAQNETMLKELAAANCAVFTFDTREAALVSSLFTYDQQTFEERYRDLFTQAGASKPANVFKEDQLTGWHSISRISTATGGKYFSNIHEYEKNLDQLQSLTGSFYVLGYYIGERWDGRYHEIKVEVKPKGYDVRAQAGYFNPKPFRDLSDLEKQLHLFDLALSEKPLLQAPLQFAMTVLSYAAGPEARLATLSKIPAEVVDRFAGKKVELVALVFDENEKVAGLQRTEADFSKYRGREIYYASGTAVQPGNYKCRLVVRDLETGAGAVATAPVYVARKTDAGFSLHSPLLLVPGGNDVYLEGAGAKKKEAFSWRNAYPYDRARYSPLIGDLPKGTTRCVAVVPCSAAGIAQPDIKMAPYFVNAASGARFPASFSVLNKVRKGDLEVQLLEMSLENIPPGKYFLYLHAEDAGSKAASHAQTTIIVHF